MKSEKRAVMILRDRTVIIANNTELCVVCGKPTNFVDYCCEVRLCSKECDKKHCDFLEEE